MALYAKHNLDIENSVRLLNTWIVTKRNNCQSMYQTPYVS